MLLKCRGVLVPRDVQWVFRGHSMTSLLKTITLLSVIMNAQAVFPLGLPTLLPPSNLSISINTSFVPRPITTDPQCIDSPNWVTPFFKGSDCSIAVDKFHNREYPIWSTTYLEFFAYRFYPPLPSVWAQRTPRRYRHKSCTMAIVMLGDMPSGIVPPPATRYSTSDLASYADLERAARGILLKCISPVRKQGAGLDGRRIDRARVGFTNPTGFGITGKLVAFACISMVIPCKSVYLLTMS